MAAYSDLTVGGPIGFVLTVEACPYVFTTAGVTAFSFTSGRDDDWPISDLEPTVAAGYLDDTDGFEWSETVDIVKATSDVSAITFRVHDAIATSGDANGNNLMSWLAARTPSSSPLVATLSSTLLVGTFDVADGSVFGGAPFTVWIGREAIRISTRAGNTLTIGKRGVLGSKARTHKYDADAELRPEVWTALPWAARRRVILWAGAVSGGTMTDPVPLWRGLCSRAPRLANDGTRWELACDHVTQEIWDVRLGLPTEACRLQGYRTNSWTGMPLSWSFQALIAGTERSQINAQLTPGTNYETLDALCGAMQTRMFERMAAAPGGAITGDPMFRQTDAGAVTARLVISGATRIASAARVLGQSYLGGTLSSNQTSVTLPIPTAIQGFDGRSNALSEFRMDSVATLPTTWGTTPPSSQGWRHTVAVAVLQSSGERERVIIDPTSYIRDSATLAVVDASLRTVKGRVVRHANGATDTERRTQSVFAAPGPDGWFFLVGGIPFVLVIRIDCTDWVYGFEKSIIGDTILAGTPQEIDIDSRDWTFENALQVALRSPPMLQGRDWLLNGEQTLGTLLLDNLRITGAFIAIRRSRLSIEPIDPPLRSDVSDSAHTVTTANMPGNPTWMQIPDGIANVADVKVADEPESMRFVLTDGRSVQKFGARDTIKIEPRGLKISALRHIRTRGARYVADTLFRRVLSLHGDIAEEREVAIDARQVSNVYLGEIITLSEWLTPNASGGRGVTTQRGVVLGRTIKIGGRAGAGREGASMKVKLRRWPALGNLAGWSPCVRVSSVSGADATCAGPGYIAAMDDSSTDYAGSDLSGYANATRATVADDGGTGYIKASDRVRFVERDVTVPQTADMIVSTVNTATRVITMTAAIPAWVGTAIGAGGIVDITYSPYNTAGLQTAQKDWPFVCDRATRKILAGTDDGYRWVP